MWAQNDAFYFFTNSARPLEADGPYVLNNGSDRTIDSLEPRNTSIDVSEASNICKPTDFEALKL